MGKIEKNWFHGVSRRDAMRNLAAFFAGSPLLVGQQDAFRDHSRVPAMDELITAFDFEAVAYEKLPRDAYDYTAYGVESEFTLRRNREAFDWVDLVPKGVVDVSSVNTATEVLGTKMDFPIMISPTASHSQLHPDGEIATYGGATAAKTPFIVSNNASFPLEKIAAAAKGSLWWQLYPRQDLNATKALLDTALTHGSQAIVVTVDQQSSSYERAAHGRNLSSRGGRGGARAPRGGRVPARRGGAGARGGNPYRVTANRLWYTWDYMEKVREMVKVPVLVKGILTAEDAELCVKHGMNGVIVSNHGGRSMDYGPSTLEVLPEIVKAVNGRIPVIIDSGFRRGSDILKALALGANAVCLGRVPRWGLGAYGEPGVQRILEILQAELMLAMAQTGRPTIASIDRTLVRTEFA